MSDHDETDDMPIIEEYRGVGIHDFQPRERIEAVVKPAIDAVYRLTDGLALLTFARDIANAPEARLFAAARIEAIWQLAAENREVRPEVKPEQARWSTGALDSLRWANPRGYGSLLEPGPAPGEHRLAREASCSARLALAQEHHAATQSTLRRREGAGV